MGVKKGVHVIYKEEAQYNQPRNSRSWPTLKRQIDGDGSRIQSLWTKGQIDAYTKYYKITLSPDGDFKVELHPQIIKLIDESGIGDLKWKEGLHEESGNH